MTTTKKKPKPKKPAARPRPAPERPKARAAARPAAAPPPAAPEEIGASEPTEAADDHSETPPAGTAQDIASRVRSFVDKVRELAQEAERLDEKVQALAGRVEPRRGAPRGPPALGLGRDGQPNEEERRLVLVALKLRLAVGSTEAVRRLTERGLMLRDKPWTGSRLVWAAERAEAGGWLPPELARPAVEPPIPSLEDD